MPTNYYAQPIEAGTENDWRRRKTLERIMPFRDIILEENPGSDFEPFRYNCTKGKERFSKFLSKTPEKQAQVLLFVIWMKQVAEPEEICSEQPTLIEKILKQLTTPEYAHIHLWIYGENYHGQQLLVEDIQDFLDSLCYGLYLHVIRHYASETFGLTNIHQHNAWVEIINKNGHPAFLPQAGFTINFGQPHWKSISEA
jgi:hypothetical protein